MVNLPFRTGVVVQIQKVKINYKNLRFTVNSTSLKPEGLGKEGKGEFEN
jgi:hypothetical protein